MKPIFLISLFLISIYCLPYPHQLTLANSLVVGRSDKAWQCKICDNSNKPKTAHYIHHLVQDVKCILSVYK